jgi:hypothetical protein
MLKALTHLHGLVLHALRRPTALRYTQPVAGCNSITPAISYATLRIFPIPFSLLARPIPENCRSVLSLSFGKRTVIETRLFV